MKKLLIVVISFFGILTLLLVSLPLFFDGRVEDANIHRQVTPAVMWGMDEMKIDLDISSDQLPSCQNKTIPMDVVLLLDRSGSMDGFPWQQASAATVTFIENMDLTAHQVSVVQFSDQAETVFSLGNNFSSQNVSDTLSAVQPTGGTSIADALVAAQNVLLSPERRLDANLVVVLFSDGGDLNQEVVFAADELKILGARIIPVGLQGDDFQEDVLREIASTPRDLYIAPDPAELSTIYENLAMELNRTIATNVEVIENYDADAFQLVETSELAPEGSALMWYSGTMTEGGLKISYQLQAKKYGIHSVNPQPGNVSLYDCKDDPFAFSTIVGPSVIVLPPWYWLMLGLLPLFLIPIWKIINRQEKRPIRADAHNGEITKVTYPPFFMPNWIGAFLNNDNVSINPETGYLSTENLAETVVIGAGNPGRLALEQLAQDIGDRYGVEYDQKLRLLQIDVTPVESSLNRNKTQKFSSGKLLEDQVVVLKPDYTEIDQTLRQEPEKYTHWQWWGDNSADFYGRAGGRMAIFSDLSNGISNSTLWKGLTRTFRGLNNPQIWLVVSAYDIFGSGMIVDIARLCQLVLERTERVSVILLLPDETVLEQDVEAKAKSIAALRELERLSRNLPVDFTYTPFTGESYLNQKINQSVLGDIIVFDPLHDLERMSANTKAENINIVVSNFLLAMFDQELQSEFDEVFNKSRAQAGILANQQDVSTVVGVGTYTLQIPVQAIRRAVEWRIVHDILFDHEIGLIRSRRLGEDHTSQLQSPAPLQVDDMVDQFLLSIDVDPDNMLDLSDEQEQRMGMTFGRKLFEFTLDILNGTSPEAVFDNKHGRSNRLPELDEFLNALSKKLSRGIRSPNVREAGQLVNELSKAVKEWVSVFSVDAARTTRRATSAISKTPPLWDAWQQEYQKEIETLQGLVREPSRFSFLDQESLEYPYYRDTIRSGDVAADDALARILRRIGWCWTKNNNGMWELRLLIIPIADRVPSPPPADMLQWSFGAQDYEMMLRQLHSITRLFSTSVVKTDISRYLSEPNKISYPPLTTWIDESNLKVSYNANKAPETIHGSVPKQSFLLLQDTLLRENLIRQLHNLENKLNLKSVAFKSDPYSCHLIQVSYLIPLQLTTSYDSIAWQSYYNQASLHVWSAEQQALQLEDPASRFSADFVALLDDAPKAELFGLSLIYGLIVSHNPYKLMIDGTELWRSSSSVVSPTDAMREFLESTLRRQQLDTLKQAIEKKRAMITGQKFDYFKRVKDRMVQPLMEQKGNNLAVSFGYFLSGLIQQEELR